MKATADVVIIGGGIIGAACAYYLTRDGLHTCLIERDAPASGTSGACDGLILLWDKLNETELTLGRLSAALWEQLAEQLPMNFEYRRDGTLMLAETGDQLAAAREKAHQLRSVGVAAQVLGPADLRRLEPHLAPDLAGGVYFSSDAQLDPRLATVSLIEAAKGMGLTVLAGATATGIRLAPDGRVCGVRYGSREVTTPCVVCAAGVWSTMVAASANLELPIRPRKGHIIVTGRRPAMVNHPLLEGGYAASVGSTSTTTQVAFVAERTRAGSMLLGSSREFSGFDRTVSIDVIQAIASRAKRFLPELEKASVIRSYAGLRPWSPDHLPLIGHVAAVPGFYLATGHEGSGVGLAPITGQIIAQAISGREQPSIAHAVRPDRFVAPHLAGAV